MLAWSPFGVHLCLWPGYTRQWGEGRAAWGVGDGIGDWTPREKARESPPRRSVFWQSRVRSLEHER